MKNMQSTMSQPESKKHRCMKNNNDNNNTTDEVLLSECEPTILMSVMVLLCVNSLFATSGPNAHTSLKHPGRCWLLWTWPKLDTTLAHYWLPQMNQMHTQTHEILMTAVNMTKIRHSAFTSSLLAATSGPNAHNHSNIWDAADSCEHEK